MSSAALLSCCFQFKGTVILQHHVFLLLHCLVSFYNDYGLFVSNLFSLVKLLNRLLPDSHVKYCARSQLQGLSQMSLSTAKYYICLHVFVCFLHCNYHFIKPAKIYLYFLLQIEIGLFCYCPTQQSAIQ